MKTLFSYQKDAWNPRIGGFTSYAQAEKAFKDEFYYSGSNPGNMELQKIAIQYGIDPMDTQAVKKLFASFSIKSYQEE